MRAVSPSSLFLSSLHLSPSSSNRFQLVPKPNPVLNAESYQLKKITSACQDFKDGYLLDRLEPTWRTLTSFLVLKAPCYSSGLKLRKMALCSLYFKLPMTFPTHSIRQGKPLHLCTLLPLLSSIVDKPYLLTEPCLTILLSIPSPLSLHFSNTTI